MAEQWVVRMARGGLESAGALRLRRIDVCECRGSIWLRGNEPYGPLQDVLAALPEAERFDVDAKGALTRVGCRVPFARLPEGPWVTLASALRITPQTTLLPALTPAQTDVWLERSARELEPNVLLATAESWRAFALSASVLRLKPLSFALSSTTPGRAVIWGKPVPPIPGMRCVEREGVAVPCGFEVRPIADPEVLQAMLGLMSGDLALFQDDGGTEIVESHQFVPATRGAVRSSFAPPSVVASPMVRSGGERKAFS